MASRREKCGHYNVSLLMTSLTRTYAPSTCYIVPRLVLTEPVRHMPSLWPYRLKSTLCPKDVLEKSKMLGIWLMSPEISMDNCACATALRKRGPAQTGPADPLLRPCGPQASGEICVASLVVFEYCCINNFEANSTLFPRHWGEP